MKQNVSVCARHGADTGLGGGGLVVSSACPASFLLPREAGGTIPGSLPLQVAERDFTQVPASLQPGRANLKRRKDLHVELAPTETR